VPKARPALSGSADRAAGLRHGRPFPHQLMSPDLINRSLVIVTGKGGVGKSSVAAALALSASQRGKRTLVCELDAKGDLARLLGSAPVGYTGSEVRPGLVAMTMDTEKSLVEYLRVQARIPFVGKIAPLARVFEFVATAAPGVREVLTVGKLAWEARHSDFDLVIADATATGHSVGELSAPSSIRDLIRLGMIRTQLDWMVEMLEDPEQTAAVVVTTPEEMPVVETIELVDQVREVAHIDVAAVVANRVLPAPFTMSERLVFDDLSDVVAATTRGGRARASSGSAALAGVISATSHALRRREVGSAHLKRLRAELPLGMPVLLLPELFEAAGASGGVELLAGALADEANW